MNSSSMQIFFRALFIAVLLISAGAASLFMILESAEFFGRFYPSEKINFGLWGAGLNELFLVIMAAVWLPAIEKGQRKIFHPGNLWVKLLVVLLFLNTVGGATLNVVQTKFDELQEQENRIRILKIRRSQIEDHKENLKTFAEQNQRLNTVLSSREIQSVKEELIALESKQQSTLTLWLDIILAGVLRFTIQLANITAVWLASWLYRQPLGKASECGIPNPPAPFRQGRSYVALARGDGIHENARQIEESRSTQSSEAAQIAYLKTPKTELIASTPNGSIDAKPHARTPSHTPPTSFKPGEVNAEQAKPEAETSARPDTILAQTVQHTNRSADMINANLSLIEGDDTDGYREDMADMGKAERAQILQLMSERNPGTSVKDLLTAAKIPPRAYKQLIEQAEEIESEEDLRQLRTIRLRLEKMRESYH